jgi:ribosome recycling factor
MFPFRSIINLNRTIINSRWNTVVKQKTNACDAAVYSNSSLTFVRNFAKSKDKKKDSKNPTKIQINEDQLANIINVNNLKSQMLNSITIMKNEFAKNLSLRSTTGAVETLRVSAEGKDYELQEIGQIIRKNPKTIVINMIGFPQLIPFVLQALEKSGMNLNPQQDGTTIFLPVPKVTKEHREMLFKNAKALFIKCRDGIKDTQNDYVKKVKRKADLSVDENHQIQMQIIAMGDKHVAEAEKLLQAKQTELLSGKE